MADLVAVCQDGVFEEQLSLSGSRIVCTGTLVNRTPTPALVELEVSDLQDLTSATLLLFAIAYGVKSVARLIWLSFPGRGG